MRVLHSLLTLFFICWKTAIFLVIVFIDKMNGVADVSVQVIGLTWCLSLFPSFSPFCLFSPIFHPLSLHISRIPPLPPLPFLSSAHRLIATSPPELEKQLHLCIITANVCSSCYHLLKLRTQKPAVMNLNTARLWSQYHNAYLSEISSSFPTTLWSLSRSEAQKLLQEPDIGQVKRRTGELCNPLWVTQHNIISLLFML